MGWLVFDVPAIVFKRRAQPFYALGVFRRGKAVEALLMDAVNDPGFPGNEYGRFRCHFDLVQDF